MYIPPESQQDDGFQIDLPYRVAIIGRPNVGKSTLFNLLTETRKALVLDQPGVTRDIIVEEAEVWGKPFQLIDTGGVTDAQDVLSPLIKEQVENYVYTVDAILVVVDGRTGLVPEDRAVVTLAQKSKKPFLLLVNKVDSVYEVDERLPDFYELGVDMIATSFEQRQGLSGLLEWLDARVPAPKSESVKPGFSFALVGKPNAGKSALCNAILGEERMIVSSMAGTTVDAVETHFKYEGQEITLVDTAGMRKSARREEDLEILSAFKSMNAIGKVDILVLAIDGTLGPSDQDAKILEMIVEKHKGVIVAITKADLLEQGDREKLRYQIQSVFHFFTDIQVVFTSSKNRRGIRDLLQTLIQTQEKLSIQIPTRELNDFFLTAIRGAPSPVYATTNVKFYYLTQTRQKPPSFIAFANHPDGVNTAYRRFLAKRIKEHWSLEGIPIRIFAMKASR